MSSQGAELVLLSLSQKISRPIDIDKQWYVFKGLKIFGNPNHIQSLKIYKFGSEIDN